MKVLRGTWIVTLSLVITGACGESDDEGAFEANGDGSTNCPVGQIGCPCTKGRGCDPPGECDIPRFRCVAEDAAGGTAGAAGTGGGAGASGGAAGVDASGGAGAGGASGMSGAGGDTDGGSGAAGQSGTAGVGGSDAGPDSAPIPCKTLNQPCTVKAECCAPYVCTHNADAGRSVCSLLTCKGQTCEETQCNNGGWMPVTPACPRAKIAGCTKCTPRCDATLGCTCLCAETSCFHQDVCELRCPADC